MTTKDPDIDILLLTILFETGGYVLNFSDLTRRSSQRANSASPTPPASGAAFSSIFLTSASTESRC